jgi:hypothetical protein
MYKIFIHLFSFWLRYALFSALFCSYTAKSRHLCFLSVLADQSTCPNSPKKIAIFFGSVDLIEEKHA